MLDFKLHGADRMHYEESLYVRPFVEHLDPHYSIYSIRHKPAKHKMTRMLNCVVVTLSQMEIVTSPR